VVKASGEALTRVLAACAAQDALTEVVSRCAALLHKHEHVAALLAALAERCVAAEDPALPHALLHALFGGVDPSTYKEAATRQSGGVANVARFLTDLAERCG